MTMKLWSVRDGQPHAVTLADLVWLDPAGELHAESQADCLGIRRLGIRPLADCDGAVAALLVPDNRQRDVSRNGVAVASGVQLLQHTDEFAINGHTFWASADSQPEETTYSAARHPADAACFLTKARLREGEPITICPGRPGQSCATIYKRAAWETLVARPAPFRCPNCSFDPRAAAWQPRQRQPRPSLAGVLGLLHRGKTQ